MRQFCAAGLLALLPTAALALIEPQPEGADPHVKIATYKPTETYLVVGAVGRSLVITFNPTETIANTVLESARPLPSDPSKTAAPWETVGADAGGKAPSPSGNALPLWAILPGRSSAQVITTTADGKTRVYQFVLKTLPVQPDECDAADCDSPLLTYGLSFRYPDDVKAAAVKVAQVAQVAKVQQVAKDRLVNDYYNGPRNKAYEIQGKLASTKELGPDSISDNGQATVMQWRGNRELPSIYVIEEGSPPHQVTPEIHGDVAVFYQTAYHWRLLKGEKFVAEIFNCQGNVRIEHPQSPCSDHHDAVGFNPHTGTTNPSVVRVTRGPGP